MNNDFESLGHYIYLIPTKNGRYFKFGKSSNNSARILDHNTRFKFDLNRGLIFLVDRENVFIVESELNKKFPQCEHVYGKVDGSNEIRDFKYFKQALAYLREKELPGNSLIEIFGSDITKHIKSKVRYPEIYYLQICILKKLKYEKLNLLEYSSLYAYNLTKYYYDNCGCLNLIFIHEFDNNVKLTSEICVNRYTYKKGDEMFMKFRLTNNYYYIDEEYLTYICKVLSIKPAQSEKVAAIDRKLESKQLLKEQCISDKPICFKDFMDEELVFIKPSKLFNDLDYIRTSNIEDNFSLHYMQETTKKIIYRDSFEYRAQKNRKQYFLRRFNKTTLLEQKYLLLNDENEEKYFWFCAKFFGIKKKKKKPRIGTYGYGGSLCENFSIAGLSLHPQISAPL